MSTQVQAPPTEAETDAIDANRKRIGRPAWPDEVTTWTTIGGWCSACKLTGLNVAHMGTEDFNFALCKTCLVRLVDEHMALEQSGTEPKGSNGE